MRERRSIMENSNKFEWVDFYKEFADRLLSFKADRKQLIDVIKTVYKNINIKLPTLEKDNDISDIDPFTVFGLFNKGITIENRVRIISEFAKLLDIQSKVPQSFDSIPTLNNMNATYYAFKDERKPNEIDNLWNLFEVALNFSKNKTEENKSALTKYFDIVIDQKGIGNSKITMGLYWIAPDTFLNLDSRSEWYLYESGKIPNEIVSRLPKVNPKISSTKYFEIAEQVSEYLVSEESQTNNFKELSFIAWKEAIEDGEREKYRERSAGSGLPDDTVRYWIYSPGSNAYNWNDFYQKKIMGIESYGLGNLNEYKTKSMMVEKLREINNKETSFKNTATATWEFTNEMNIGDVVFVKKGSDKIIGRGLIISDYQYDESIDSEFKNIREVEWTHKGNWNHPGKAVFKTLTDITSQTDYVESLEALFEVELDEAIKEKIYPAYKKEDFLDQVFIDEKSYDNLVGLLENKKNIILQGAPGVGKTFMAKRLVYSIIGEENQSQTKMVQFHQSYSYEDFIEGFRPSKDGNGFEIKKGAFYKFCKKAADDIENKYFFIIDEINRGNLSKIFGELFMLIENDKRGHHLQLLYSDEQFSVPKNVYIIGMMNTADRSLAMLDYALRRRFAFYNLEPAFKSDGFLKYQENLDNEKFDKLINILEKINDDIALDESLGKGFCIGHSYVSELDDADENNLNRIVEYEIIPLITEYWFDEPERVINWENKLRNAIQ